MVKLPEVDRPQPVRGWSKRAIAIYFAGPAQGGPLDGYGFSLKFMDTGREIYSIPAQNKGSLENRFLRPDIQGVIRVEDIYLNPGGGEIVMLGWPLRARNFEGNVVRTATTYNCRIVHNTVLFRVDPLVAVGKDTDSWNGTDVSNTGSVTITTEDSRNVGVNGSVGEKDVVGAGVSGERRTGVGTSSTAPTWSRQYSRGRSTEREVEVLKNVQLRQIAKPPTL